MKTAAEVEASWIAAFGQEQLGKFLSSGVPKPSPYPFIVRLWLSKSIYIFSVLVKNIYLYISFRGIKMKIEEVKSTVKTQRISAHTHIKGKNSSVDL